jgi:hypothetical protein
MPRNPYSSFDIEEWYQSSQQTATTDEGLFDIDEWMRQAEEAQRKRDEEEERLAQEKAELEKQRKEELVTATQVDENELTYDAVLDSLIQAENPNKDPNTIHEGEFGYDYGMVQVNERWVNKGLTASGLPSFAINRETGDSDRVYIEVQDFMATKVPNWNMMSDEFRRESLLNQENNIEVGRIIYNRRGLGQWVTKDKVLDIQASKKRVDHTGDLAQKALSGDIPSLDDISVSFLNESLPSEVDPDQSIALMRNRDRKKRLEEAERPKDWLDAFKEVKETPSDIVPFLQTQNEIQELAEINFHIEGIKKADEGGYDPSPGSIAKVHEWQTKNQAETSRGYKIWNTVFGSIPFAGELLLTGGTFTGAKKIGTETLKSGIKWGLGKKGRDLVSKYAIKNNLIKKTGDIALKSTAAIGASGIQTGVIELAPELARVATGDEVGGGRIRAATLRNMMDRVGIQEDEKGNLEAVLFEEGDDFWDAFSKGTASTFIENLSERSGLLFTKLGAGKIGEIVKRGVLEKFIKLNPGSRVVDFQNILKKAGWNGVIGEVMEERVGDIGRSLTYNVTGVGDETWRLPDADELGEYVTDIATIEFPAFMIPGATIGGVTAALSRDKSNLSSPTNALNFLNKSNYKLKVEKNEKSGKFDVQAIIGGKITMVSSFDTKKEARTHLKEYAVSEAEQLREVYKQKVEAAADIITPEALPAEEVDYNRMLVRDLKANLKERGLSRAGKKADLVARLQEADKVEVPAEEVEVPAEPVEVPAEEIEVPAEEVVVPAEEIEVPGEGIIPAEEAPAVTPKKVPADYDKMSAVEQLEFSQKNLKKDLKKAKAEYKKDPSFGAQGRIDDIQGQLKAIGFQLSAAKKEAPAVEETPAEAPTVEEAPAEEEFFPQLEQSIIRKYGKNYENNPAFQEYLEENDLVDIRELDEEGQKDLHSDLTVRDVDSGFEAGFLGVTPQNLKLLGDTVIGAGRFTFQTLPKFIQKQGKALGVTTDNFKQKWDDYSVDPGKAPQQLKAYMKKVFTHMKKWYGKSKDAVVDYLKSPKIGLGIEVVQPEAVESIADRFNEDQVSNTGKIVAEKLDIATVKDKRQKGGTTRDVYNIDGKVVKVAKNPRGIEQNESLKYGDKDILGTFAPEIYEIGKDYIVTENVPRNDKEARKFLKPLQKFNQIDFEKKDSKLLEAMNELGLQDFGNYDLLWNDFKAARNWGQRENGEFVMIDEGALNKNITSTSEIPSWARQEWEEIKSQRRGIKKAAPAVEAPAAVPSIAKKVSNLHQHPARGNLNIARESQAKNLFSSIRRTIGMIQDPNDVNEFQELIDSAENDYFAGRHGDSNAKAEQAIQMLHDRAEFMFPRIKIQEDGSILERPPGFAWGEADQKVVDSKQAPAEAPAVEAERPLAPRPITFAGKNKTSQAEKTNTIQSWLSDNGMDRAGFIKEFSDLAPSKADRGGLSRAEYKDKLSKEYDSAIENIDPVTYEQILEKTKPTHTDKKGKKHDFTELKKEDIKYLQGSFGLTPESLDVVGKALVDTGRYVYDNLSPAMQKMGDRLGVNAQNFKLKFAQFKNDAKGMTNNAKKWFKKVVGHMKAWFKRNAQKLIDSKPVQKAYDRLEDMVVSRAVPRGDMPDVAPSEESPTERRSALLDFIEKNGGLPPKITPYKRAGFVGMLHDRLLVPISTRLGRIHPQLKRIIRKYHEKADIQTGQDMMAIEGFLTKVEKLDKVQRDKLDLAMINGWGKEIDQLINEYDIVEEYNKVRDVLNGIYDRAVGLDKVQYQRYRQLKDFILPDLKDTPKKAWKKDDIIAWLDRQGVKYSKTSTKAQLLDSAEKKAKSEEAKYKNLKEEFDKLDRKVTYDIPYYEHYHPREVLSYENLLGYIKQQALKKKAESLGVDLKDLTEDEKISATAKVDGDLDIALNQRARSLGVDIESLTDQQRADVINSYYRNTTGVIAKTPKSLMKRKFIELDPEMSAFYKDSSGALISYISRMNEAIARANMFGVGRGVVGANVDNLSDIDVGAFIDGVRMRQDPKNPIITSENEKEIKEIFRAKFSRNYTDSGTQALKNLVYIGTIGDYMSTLTQLGDLGFAGYRSAMAGHPIVFLKTLYKGFLRGGLKIKAKDIGMDRIAAEFSRDQAGFSKTLGWIFKKSGFAKLDRIGKEVLVNSTIETMRVQANSKKGLSKKNMGLINAAFGEGTKEAKDVIKQIKAGETNKNVISLAYWVLLEHQPVAESELPAKYLESDYGKLAYQLKTWAIKVLDVYRNEVYDTIFKKKQVMTGVTNMAQLTLALMMANVGADWLKGFILGKPIRLTDQVVDNLLKMVFLSKYTFSKRQLKPGYSHVIRGLAGNLVPVAGIADDVISDAYTVGKWFTVGLDRNESLRYDIKFASRIPFVGRFIFHRGGMQGRERVLNREKKYYTELNKERDLNKTESYNFGIVLDQLAKIELIKTQGIKGGYLYKALGIEEEDATLGL